MPGQPVVLNRGRVRPSADVMPPARAEKRRAIVDAAIEVFLESGYGAATMDAVVERVGGSKSTIYGFFGSKEGLFAAIIQEVVGEIVKPLPVFDDTESDVETVLFDTAFRHMSVVLSDRHIALVRIVAAEMHRFPELGRAYYAAGPGRGHASLEAYLRDQTQRAKLAVDDPRRAAEMFYGMLLHKATLQRLNGVLPPPTEAEVALASRATVDLFLKIHGVRRANR